MNGPPRALPLEATLRLLDNELTAAEVATVAERLRGDEAARRQAAALLLQIGVLGELEREPRNERQPWRPRRSPGARGSTRTVAAVVGACLAAAALVLLVGRLRPGRDASPARQPPAFAHPRTQGGAPVMVPAPGKNGPALLLRGDAPGMSDQAMARRLEDLGFEVSEALDEGVTADDLSGKALVVISASVEGEVVRDRLPELDLRHAPVPIVTCETSTFDLLGMTGPRSGSIPPGGRNGFGSAPGHISVEIHAPGHALAAGLQGRLRVASAPVALSWGDPASGAIRVASIGRSGSPLIVQFAYERGATMVGLAAPARRVGCFVSGEAADRLTPEGWRLFDAGVRWAAGL